MHSHAQSKQTRTIAIRPDTLLCDQVNSTCLGKRWLTQVDMVCHPVIPAANPPQEAVRSKMSATKHATKGASKFAERVVAKLATQPSKRTSQQAAARAPAVQRKGAI